jgi:hypothetical protein
MGFAARMKKMTNKSNAILLIPQENFPLLHNMGADKVKKALKQG